MRAHELAKELGLETKKLIAFAKLCGVTIKANLSAVSDEDVEKLRAKIASVRGPAEQKKTTKPKAKAKAKAKAKPKAKAKAKAKAKPKAKAKAKAKPKAKKEEAEPAEEEAPAATPAAKEEAPAAAPPPAKEEAPAAEAPPAEPISRAIRMAPGFEPPKPKPKKPAAKAPAKPAAGAPAIGFERGIASTQQDAKLPPRRARIRTVKFKKRGPRRTVAIQPKRPEGKVEVTAPLTVKSLSSAIGVKASEIIAKLMARDLMATVNQRLENEMAEELAMEYEIELVISTPKPLEEEILEETEPDKPEDLAQRAPVVTMLGHVDHGKTSLLDRIRKTNVVDGEAGGITQHMGAYTVEVKNRRVCFLDTPGHEAFTAMRARGANATDIVVLVVAADDGVMPQTEEAVNHAKAAGVKIVAAVNKIDKPNANVQRTMQQLAVLGINPQQWGGETEFVEVSAITGQGVEGLVETLALESEMLELKANPKRPATGLVLEAGLSTGRGVEATILVQNGTLRRGDFVLAGKASGSVRSMHDHNGKSVAEAGPATPVVVSGLGDIPEAGDRFQAVTDTRKAKQIAEQRRLSTVRAAATGRGKVTLENLFSRIKEEQTRDLKLVIKADAQGSVEVLTASLAKIATEEARVTLLHTGVGGIVESDVLLARASGGIVLGFHVVPDDKVRALAEEHGVEIRQYKVIYELLEDVRKGLEGLLEPEKQEAILGHAEVRQTFKVSRLGTIAGCYITDGRMTRNAQVRLTRDGTVIYEGKLGSLRRVKDDVREVLTGYECGMHIDGFDDVKPGDIIEAFEIQEVARTLG